MKNDKRSIVLAAGLFFLSLNTFSFAASAPPVSRLISEESFLSSHEDFLKPSNPMAHPALAMGEEALPEDLTADEEPEIETETIVDPFYYFNYAMFVFSDFLFLCA